MTKQISIRDEKSTDIKTIFEITKAAFETMEFSSHTEQFIVDALRKAGVLTLSMVAEVDGNVVGHIAFSPVTMSDGTPNWYGLGPVSVLPQYQKMGIGKALIKAGLQELKTMGAAGCCLVGHPEYYGKFGFENTSVLAHEGVPPEAFFVLSFNGHTPQGFVTFHDAFGATS